MNFKFTQSEFTLYCDFDYFFNVEINSEFCSVKPCTIGKS